MEIEELIGASQREEPSSPAFRTRWFLLRNKIHQLIVLEALGPDKSQCVCV